MMTLLLILVLISFANAEMENNVRIIDIPNALEEDISIFKRYSPSWSDLDTRPLPDWYDRAKIGIFLHWGVYAVPSFGSEWFWINWKADKDNQKYKDFMTKNYQPGFTYQEFAPMFTAEFFDPSSWAELFVKAGAKYVVLTSKHHEGFTLFPSKRSFSWNSVDVGPRRDIVGELAAAVRNVSLKFGVYHSLYEWYNPIYNQDKSNQFHTQTYTDTKLWPDIKQLVNDYKPSVIWSDGDWEAIDKYWKAEDLLAWLYNDSPVKDEVVVNDRWGIGIPGHHGDFYNHADRFNPGKLLNHKWENAFTVDGNSWGYRRDMHLADILSIEQLLYQVVSTVSCGGNALINVGPTKEGTIIPIFQERLLGLGKWLSINGEAIYNSSPWHSQNDTLNGNVWYTCLKVTYNATHPTHPPSVNDKVKVIFAIVLAWPEKSVLKLRDITPYLHSGTYQVEMLGNEGQYLTWKIANGEVAIQLPDITSAKSHLAWTLSRSKKSASYLTIFYLLGLGKWLSINGEAIYNSSPWHSQNDTLNGNVWYTCLKATYNATHPTHPPSVNDKVKVIFAIVLAWPEKSVLKLGDITPYLHSGTYQVEMLGNEGQYLTWKIANGEVAIQLPDITSAKSHLAWTLRFTLK